MLKPFIKLIQALSSNNEPGLIAHAFSLGMLLGFMPKDNLFWYILFVLIFFMRIQRTAFSLSIVLGALLTTFLDPVFDDIGFWILTQESLVSGFQWLLNVPGFAFTKFNNTIVMGSFAFGVSVYIPLYVLARLFTMFWRKVLGRTLANLKIVKAIEKIPLIKKIASIAGSASGVAGK